MVISCGNWSSPGILKAGIYREYCSFGVVRKHFSTKTLVCTSVKAMRSKRPFSNSSEPVFPVAENKKDKKLKGLGTIIGSKMAIQEVYSTFQEPFSWTYVGSHILNLKMWLMLLLLFYPFLFGFLLLIVDVGQWC